MIYSVPAGSSEKQTPSKVWEPFGVGGGSVCERRRAAVGRKRLWRKHRWSKEPSTEWKWPGLTPLLPSVISQGCEGCGLGSKRQPWQVSSCREVWVVHLHTCHRLPASHQRLFAVKGTVLPWERKVRFILTQGRLHKRKAIQGPENPKPDFMIVCTC